MITATAIIAAVALFTAYAATSLMRRWAPALGFIDVPNARSSHLLPTARGGGIAIVLAFFLAILLLRLCDLVDARVVEAIIFAGGAVALIGFIDDKHPLPVYVRLSVHVAAAIMATLLIGGFPEAMVSAWGVYGKLLCGFLTVLTVLWSVNLFNFMDGIDGIAASEAVFIACAAALLNWVVGGNFGITGAMLCLAAACIGFLIFNWPPASIFMGDVGSGFLGITLVLLAICASQSGKISMGVWPILGGVFLVDATVTLLRRIIRGDRWREAHRSHAYQHMARGMGSHRAATVTVLAVDVLWLFPWAWYATTDSAHEIWYLVGALLPLVAAAILLGSGLQRS
jgi:Fuc2NAc and GlcNAc transferase